MTPVGQTYQPAGPVDVRAVMTTVILGFFTAVLAAIPIWLWEISPIPTLLIVTALAQAFLIGWALSYMVGRLRMRNPHLVGTIAVACALGSVALVHYGHYLYFVHQQAEALRVSVRRDPKLSPEQKGAYLAKLDEDSLGVVSRLLQKATGRSGFLGFMTMRNEAGITLKNLPVSGLLLWLLWAGEALFAAYLAREMAVSRASRPFCEDCGYWCHPEPTLFTLPASAAEPLTEAVRHDTPSQVAQLRLKPPADTVPGQVGVTLHACPGCDQAFADVSRRVASGQKTVITVVVKPTRVSPEMVNAIRFAPVEEVQPKAAEPPSAGLTGLSNLEL